MTLPFDLSLTTAAYMAVVLFGAAFVRGYSGFGFSALVMASGGLFMNPVLLVPVVMLFNVGRVPGIMASVLYALPPAIRLTNLGIRQASPEAVEAAQAFGSTSRQLLLKVQLPLALPSIMAGVNQTVMMVLAMVVIAGMVGGAGLGLEAVNGLARSQLGQGIEAGLAIVILAVVIDRLLLAGAARTSVSGKP